MKRMLIAYYSQANGNTKRIAEQLENATYADLVRIETVKPYTGTYDEIIEQGKREVESGFQPEIKSGASVKDYDVIAVGTPTWWYTMAPAVLSFLKENDFSGKTVIPFMTNGGWPGHTIKDMKLVSLGAEVILPKEIRFDSEGGDTLVTSQKEIADWVHQVAEYCK